jgi:hypothetical protein
MTKREVFEAVIASVQADTVALEGMETDEVVAFFENEIVNLDKRAERSRATAAKKREAGDALMETVKATLTEDFQTIADIAAQIEGEEITASKVTYRLNALAKEGYAEKADVQIPATETTKARVVKAYRIAQA